MTAKKIATEGKQKSIYVIVGKDSALLSVESEKLIDTLLGAEERVTGLFKADPGEVSAAQVLDELRTVPFLTKKRVVVVKDADTFVSENRELLEAYFAKPSSTGVLILTVSSWPSQTRLAKRLGAVGELISLAQPRSWELAGRLMAYAEDAHGKKLTKDAARLLIELVGDNLLQLYGEIDKLALFARAEKVITERNVETLTGHNRLFNCFEVMDAAVAGDVGAAVNRLRNMFAEDRSAEYTAIGAFAYHFRRMFAAKVLLEKGKSTAEISAALRIWRGKEESFFSHLRKMSLRRIGEILEKLTEIDYAIKTGRTKTEVAAEQLVLEMVSA